VAELADCIADVVRILSEGVLGEYNRAQSTRDQRRRQAWVTGDRNRRRQGHLVRSRDKEGGGVWTWSRSGRHKDPVAWLRHHQLGDQPERQPWRRPIATYDYTDESGTLLFQVVRFPNHDFSQRKPDGAGGWIWKTRDVRKVLYHLPELIAARRTNGHAPRIYIAEGEKDVDRMRTQWGVVATTNPGGVIGTKKEDAKKWLPEFDNYFAGADVVILPDNDDAGRACRDHRRPPDKIAAIVRVVELPGLPDKGNDISRWLDLYPDATQSDLETIIDGVEPLVETEQPNQQRLTGWLDYVRLEDDPQTSRQWLVNGWLPMTKPRSCWGWRRGKTLLGHQLATVATLGFGRWLGMAFTAMKAALVLCEDNTTMPLAAN
jgi:hypothetical protein